MSIEHVSETFQSLRRAAAQVGVPAAWLRSEARAGRVPALRAGRRLLFQVEAVKSALIERTRQRAEVAADA